MGWCVTVLPGGVGAGGDVGRVPPRLLRCLTARADALFELTEAVSCASLIVADTGYDITRLAFVLADLPVCLLGRLRRSGATATETTSRTGDERPPTQTRSEFRPPKHVHVAGAAASHRTASPTRTARRGSHRHRPGRCRRGCRSGCSTGGS